MAGARKDVDLIIRARDEAGRALDNITKAINGLVSSQNKLDASSADTSSNLERIGKAVGTLDKAFKGLNLGQNLTRQLEQAQRGLNVLEQRMQETQAESRRLTAEYNKQAAATENLTRKYELVGRQVERQQAAARQQAADQRQLTAALKAATGEREKAARQENRLTDQIARQTTRVEQARAKYQQLSAALTATANPTKRFQTQTENASNALAKAQARLDELSTKLHSTRGAYQQSAQQVEVLTREVATIDSAVRQANEALDAAKAKQREFGEAAKTSARAQQELRRSLEGIEGSIAEQRAAYERGQKGVQEYSAIAREARVEMDRLAAAARGPMLAAFAQQKRVVDELGQAWRENQSEVKRLAREIDRVGVPTREMAEAFNAARAAARTAKEEYQQQRIVITRLRGELRQAATDTDQLAAKQRTFQTAVVGGSAALDRVAGATRNAASASQILADATARTNQQQARQAGNVNRVVPATNAATGATNRLADAYRRLYGESRKSMSLLQRMRGEVLSLVAAHAGLYAIIGVLRETVGAYLEMEAVANRLNAVFEGNYDRTAQEIDFLRRTADRLGITLSVLGNEYSKFAVAANAAGFESQSVRDVFISVAEAGRVNKLSMQQMSGIFLALQQMISKGKITAEELTRQLGDRLPGAANIMAEALYGSADATAQLFADMKAGVVRADEDTMLKFAATLDKWFGDALPDSLETTTTALGQMKNAVFQAMLAFSEGGFLEGFDSLLKSITATLRSSEFAAFSARLSQGLGGLMETLGFVIENFQLLASVMVAVIGIRLIPFFASLATAFMQVTFQARMAHASFAAVRAGTASMVSTTTAAATATSRLALAMRGLMSATGVGLLITAVSTAFTFWATSADDASEAMTKHRRIIDGVRNAYDQAEGSVEEWREGILKTATATEIEGELNRLRQTYERQFRALAGEATQVGDSIRYFYLSLNPATRDLFNDIQEATKQFRDGETSVEEYIERLDQIGQATDDADIDAIVEALLEQARQMADTTGKMEDYESALDVLNGVAEDAAAAQLGFAGAVETANDAMDPEKASAYAAALREMADHLPELSAELEHLERLAEVDAAYRLAVENAQNPYQRAAAASMAADARRQIMSDRELSVFEKIADNTGVTREMFELIYGSESFKSTAYNDLAGTPREAEGTWTIGYGTIMVDNVPVQPGQTITVEKAMQEAVGEMSQIVAAIEGMVDVPLSPQQMQALVSYAYNAGIGSLRRDNILQPLNRGDYAGAQQAIFNGVDTAQGMFMQGLRNRREREAALFGQGMQDPEIVRQLAEQEAKRLEDQEKFNENLQRSIEDQMFELEIAKQGVIERETAKALREAELEAQKAGVELTDAQRQSIIETTAARYADEAAQDAQTAAEERRAAAQQQVNDLMSVRRDLLEQIEAHEEQGNESMVAQLRTELDDVNSRLQEAIQNAIAMWEAIGGTEAEAAIASLRTANVEASKLDENAKKNWLDWDRVGQLFATGLTNGIMKFAEAVANGEDAIHAAWQAFLQFAADFLIQIAQMIIQQAILNALQSAFGIGGGGGVGVPLGHTGGRVGTRIGSGNSTRTVNPAIFAGAPRFHNGGIPGLRPGEVPAILREEEEVLTRNDPRHILNGGGKDGEGGSGGSLMDRLKIVNAIDSASVVEAALATEAGERVFINFLRANSSAVKSALG